MEIIWGLFLQRSWVKKNNQMSVSRTDAIVYGWKLPYGIRENFDDEKFLPLIEGHKGEDFTLVIDGMCGGYIVFGLRLASGGDTYEGWDFINLDFKDLDAEKVKAKYRELFGLSPDALCAEPYLFIFSHFS